MAADAGPRNGAARRGRARDLAKTARRTRRVSRRARHRQPVCGAISFRVGDLRVAWNRSDARSHSRQARCALSHGRDRRRRDGAQFDRRAVGVRRSRLHRVARRQSPRQQFSDGSGRVRRPDRRRHRRRDRELASCRFAATSTSPRPIRPARGAHCPPPLASNATPRASAPESTRCCRLPSGMRPPQTRQRRR